jgi:IS605 OrfB family transposase
MKLVKSYTARIEGNVCKSSNLLFILSTLQQLSEYAFSLGLHKWLDQKELYHLCRERFPELNSKHVQQFLKFYRSNNNRDLEFEDRFPKHPVKANIILDNQNFDLEFNPDTKYTNYWLRFGRKNYPLRGKRILSRIKDVSGVQECRIFVRNNKTYCKLTYVEEVPEPKSTDNPVGIDLNTKRIVSSSNKVYHMKRLFHRKMENKKNRGKNNIDQFTKHTIHQITNQIIADLVRTGSKVLILEDLTGLRKSSSRKNGTSKGPKVDHIVNNCFPFDMLRQILSYKCLENGIKLEFVDPAYTSKTCSRCGSQETLRETQSRFECTSCGFQLDADLNASRNILFRYTGENGLSVDPARFSFGKAKLVPLGTSS